MYLGIDIHKRYSQVAVVDSDGNLQQESRLPNDRLADLAEEYAGSVVLHRRFRCTLRGQHNDGTGERNRPTPHSV